MQGKTRQLRKVSPHLSESERVLWLAVAKACKQSYEGELADEQIFSGASRSEIRSMPWRQLVEIARSNLS